MTIGWHSTASVLGRWSCTISQNQVVAITINTNGPRVFADVVQNVRDKSETVLSMVSVSFANVSTLRQQERK